MITTTPTPTARESTPTIHEPTLLSSLRALPRPVWILFLGTFLNKFGTFVVPFLTLYLTRQGYSLASAGMAIGAYGVGNLIASLLGGHLADTIGRRKTIVLSMFSAAAAMMLLSRHAVAIIIALTALAGDRRSVSPATSLLADLVSPSRTCNGVRGVSHGVQRWVGRSARRRRVFWPSTAFSGCSPATRRPPFCLAWSRCSRCRAVCAASGARRAGTRRCGRFAEIRDFIR